MRIAVITHPLDRRLRTWLDGSLPVSRDNYLVDPVLIAARRLGLRWFYTDPHQRFRPADAAFLHADMSVMPQEYLDLAARYPRTVNGQVNDIRKRKVSSNLLDRDSAWGGPVLVKSDLNANGGPERFLARKSGSPENGAATTAGLGSYRLFDRLAGVPQDVWRDPNLVVERYLPERRDLCNVLRVWSFLGDYERCTWYTSHETIIKGRGFLSFGPSPVPDFLRDERKRLGFDYGKFDFAIGPDGPVLYDANRTPAALVTRPDLMQREAPSMAKALIALIKG